MCGAPWHGEAKLGYSTQTPLDEILYLGRGEDNEVGPVTTLEAVARLMASSFVPSYNASAHDDVLAFHEHVSEVVSRGELRLAPDERVLEFAQRVHA